MDRGEPLVVGRVGAAFGTRGWVRLQSYTRPRDNLFDYAPWLIRCGGEWKTFELRERRRHHGSYIARLGGVDDRSRAESLVRAEIAIPRDRLPDAGADEYYWRDLIGLAVFDREDRHLGRVRGLYETGAHDVLRVATDTDELLIPFVTGVYVLNVDLVAGRLCVDWPPER